MTVLGPKDLPAFIDKIDSLGGPGDPRVEDYWRHSSYAPEVAIDIGLDPFGSDYLNAQLALYREISGRDPDQSIDQRTIANRDAHLKSRNPYNHGVPSVLATQLTQLSTAMRLAKPRRGAKMVDMGCGWGLASELASYLGLDVEAVDINRDFVALVHERSSRYGYEIKANHASFDTYSARTPVDLFLFHESLHHAVAPWALIARLARMLTPSGKIVACGEPINTHWWPHWGLRLDPMSIFCIHKHGWFESGWSLDFLVRCFDRALLNVQVTADPDPMIGHVVVASNDAALNAEWLHRNATIEGGALDRDLIVASEAMQICFRTPVSAGRNTIVVQNYRPQPVRSRLRRDGGPAAMLTLLSGENRVSVDAIDVGTTLLFESETWRPSEEIGNLDTRRLAFQISGIIPDPQRNARNDPGMAQSHRLATPRTSGPGQGKLSA